MNAMVIQVNNIICCKYAAEVLNKIMGIIEIYGRKRIIYIDNDEDDYDNIMIC